MTPRETPVPLGAALAGIPSGVRSTGPWAGRRQLFVRFARVAETATMWTADALRNELVRLAQRSVYHSTAICGGDPLGEADFLAAALEKAPLSVMLDHDIIAIGRYPNLRHPARLSPRAARFARMV